MDARAERTMSSGAERRGQHLQCRQGHGQHQGNCADETQGTSELSVASGAPEDFQTRAPIVTQRLMPTQSLLTLLMAIVMEIGHDEEHDTGAKANHSQITSGGAD